MKNSGQTDKTMEKMELMREHMDNRAAETADMIDSVGIDAEAEAELGAEIRELAESMGQGNVQPVQQNNAPVYEEAAEEV